MNTTSNTDDMIDSRDVIARTEELETERTELTDALEEAEQLGESDRDEESRDAVESARQALTDWDGENGAELESLRALAAEAEGYAADWHHGETLIRDSYFQDYAQQLADDIGAIDGEQHWPLTCIDWEQAARELQMDYSAVDFGGVTYWVR